ncbi:hypothetical protein ILUMI_21783 [Ignelater luminosus]|uniref:Evolutionarily conserved signaling intermediate in Toll pathway, mitochondrial n=1 Tax=Ignelater luminosus TaxID=2038154 RepID=A0A8K0CDY9_IGNLU|nr:hypothetical protein ILUMI_21783 [Ignelater luminosus]
MLNGHNLSKTMLRKSVLMIIFNYCKYRTIGPKFINLNHAKRRNLHISSICFGDPTKSKDIVIYENFEAIKEKNKKTYLEMLKIFGERDVHRRGHVEFIYSALKNMESFGVHKDLEVYKALVDVLPKGKFIPTNIFQAEFMHYPKQQQCAIDLLEQMEDNGVMPDYEMEDILLNIFGRRGYPLRKFWRMMYWMPKFKNLSPWPLPSEIPNDIFELAKLAVERISSIDIQSKISVYQTADIQDAVEDTWIVSGQSITQQKLLSEHNVKQPVYVEGSFQIWIKNKLVNYFILRADPKPIPKEDYDPDDVSHINVPLFGFTPPSKKSLMTRPSVHEQEDGVVLAVCVTGTSGRDSLLSWIRHLEADGNPALAEIPVVFTLRAPEKEIATADANEEENSIEKM